MLKIDEALIMLFFNEKVKSDYQLRSEKASVLKQKNGGFVKEIYEKVIIEKKNNHSIFVELFLDPLSFEIMPNRVYIKTSNDDELADILCLYFFEKNKDGNWYYFPSTNIDAMLKGESDTAESNPQKLKENVVLQIFDGLSQND
jgi:hypothetical protein